MFLRKFAMIILFVHSNYTFSLRNVGNNDSNGRFKRYDRSKEFPLNKFGRYSEIMSYIEGLATKYPDLVEMLNIGNSYEGRPMPCIRISSNLKQQTKPMILVDAGIHAREWIAPSTALYLIHQLVENPKYINMSSNVDWLIMPLVNPDGYEYSHTNDRMWRKNRSKGTKCHGVDLNRNFDFHWMEQDSSDRECTENYAGSKAFSEPESRNFRDIATKFKKQVKLYVTLHSYGPMLLYPWSYTKKVLVHNLHEHIHLGNLVVNAIRRVRGTFYSAGVTSKIYDKSSGVSDDWMKAVLKVPLIFTIELVGGGSEGFDPLPTCIIPAGKEMFQGFKVMYEYIAEKTTHFENNK